MLGAVLSGLAGFIGMTVATMANARTTQAARSGPQVALPLAFRGGAVMGFSVAGLSLLGLSLSYIVFVDLLEVDQPFQVVTAFGLGASSIALFSRVGGGIYTKAADVGADLVGKVEAGIPEDDPRNPATIADNVGDNVGDVAGMGADLFESYAGAIIAPIALAAFAFNFSDELRQNALLFPLAVGAFGMVASIIGAFMVKSKPNATTPGPGPARSTGARMWPPPSPLVLAFVFGYIFFNDVEAVENWWGFPVALVAGLFVGMGIGFVSEYYTSDHYGPVKRIARQSETGPATTVLSGISAGLQSVASAVVLIAVAVAVAYWAANQAVPGEDITGIYGIAIAAIGMLATTGVVVERGCLRAHRRQRRRHRRDGRACHPRSAPSPTPSTPSATPRRQWPRASPSGRRRSPPWPSSRPSSRRWSTPARRSASTSARSRSSSASSSAPCSRSSSPPSPSTLWAGRPTR